MALLKLWTLPAMLCRRNSHLSTTDEQVNGLIAQHNLLPPSPHVDFLGDVDGLTPSGDADGAPNSRKTKLFIAEVPFDEWRENCKLLMRVLSAVAELHPFAAGKS